MSVDLTEFELEHMAMMHDYREDRIDARELARRDVALIADVARAVLADTAAPPDPKPAESDVPEWLVHWCHTTMTGEHLRAVAMATELWKSLSPLVEAATADLRKQLAESAKNNAEYHRQVNTLCLKMIDQEKQLADRDRRITELEFDLRHADSREQSRKKWLAEKERKLAERDAEIERLTKFHTEAQSAINTLRLEANDENARLTAELAEARKPVEDVDWRAAWKAYLDLESVASSQAFREAAEPLLQRARAARLEAERREDELREFVRTKRVMLHEISRRDFFTVSRECVVTDTELDKLLAAYRQSKPEAAGGDN